MNGSESTQECSNSNASYFKKLFGLNTKPILERSLDDQQFDFVIHKIPYDGEHADLNPEPVTLPQSEIDFLVKKVYSSKCSWSPNRNYENHRPSLTKLKPKSKRIVKKLKVPVVARKEKEFCHSSYSQSDLNNNTESEVTAAVEVEKSPLTRRPLAVINNSTVAVQSLPDLPTFQSVKRPRLSENMAEFSDEKTCNHTTNNGDINNCVDNNVASLNNMGNTCFLNSVIYALRFTPTFLHNLHHLLTDLVYINNKLKENKTKTSSLGRTGSAISGPSWRSESSKDLLSIGNNDITPKSKQQIVTEKLHALYVTLNNLEQKTNPGAYEPEAVLQAIGEANPLFEGNHQQDAHELFVELLNCLRVTCAKLNEQVMHNPELSKSPVPNSANSKNSKLWGMRKSSKRSAKKKDKIGGDKKFEDNENEGLTVAESEDNLSSDSGSDVAKKQQIGYNFIAEDFQGISLHRTKCLECEEVSDLKEPFLEIQVPVNCKDQPHSDEPICDSQIFSSLCLSTEKLCDQNKYFCGVCNKHNEAERKVLYEKLPNILILHLKRFTTTLYGVRKVNTYVPTPLEIMCFCESCTSIENPIETRHKYQLNCVIMHLGNSMENGHYITYSRASVKTTDYTECTRETPKNYFNTSGKDLTANFLKIFKPKALGEMQNGTGLNAKKNELQICQGSTCCGINYKMRTLTHCNDWLEFDDEKIRLLSKEEFLDMLNRRHATYTPYLLFYSKI
ncbi:hypothetical protein ABEB36_012055 [Hypothenemus hampei]|uniref:USP domain-containing protein n=1 Tax=Hypothenemus hampei TaxID=57062 RepID=A0ABD1EA76_HYPHA